ncbi:MAG: hypothetical protein K0R03_2128 [Moraxellaceae bacterium]|nr:hypothetical protein [Moraxellaceae bacterium]
MTHYRDRAESGATENRIAIDWNMAPAILVQGGAMRPRPLPEGRGLLRRLPYGASSRGSASQASAISTAAVESRAGSLPRRRSCTSMSRPRAEWLERRSSHM